MAPELETALSNPSLDFTGKTIRVVTTHEGSGLGRVVEDVKKICKGANVVDSIAIRGSECKNAMNKNKNENEILIYEDKNGITKVNVTFSDEDVWLTQNQIAEIYQTTKQNISQHIKAIYKDKELPEDSTVKNILTVQNEGNRSVSRRLDYYNLDMIIALGYRVQSDVAIRFRIWATKKLHEYIQKGFTLIEYRRNLKYDSNKNSFILD